MINIPLDDYKYGLDEAKKILAFEVFQKFEGTGI